MKAAVEMDRIQQTLEIVRDSVPGELTFDARMARSLAIQALEAAKFRYRQRLIAKLAEADEERFAELRGEHWYLVHEDIEHDYRIGMIDQETFERLSGLLDEKREADIRRRKYEDDYMQVLKKVIQAVRGMQTSCADDYNRIAELWQEPQEPQEPKKQREPRRVDLRDIRIPIDKKHSGELEAAIDKVQAGVKVRMVDIDDIFDMADYVKSEYKGKVPRTALAGTKVIVDANAQTFAKSYGYMPVSTIAELTFSERQVYLTALYRGRCDKYKYDWRMSEAARDILDAQDE